MLCHDAPASHRPSVGHRPGDLILTQLWSLNVTSSTSPFMYQLLQRLPGGSEQIAMRKTLKSQNSVKKQELALSVPESPFRVLKAPDFSLRAPLPDCALLDR